MRFLHLCKFDIITFSSSKFAVLMSSLSSFFIILPQNQEKDKEDSGSAQDEKEDEEYSTDKASGHAHLSTHDHNFGAPIKMDADPRGEPVIVKLVHQPIRFNDAPGKKVKVVTQKKDVKDANPNVTKKKKKVSKKKSSDKIAKGNKH